MKQIKITLPNGKQHTGKVEFKSDIYYWLEIHDDLACGIKFDDNFNGYLNEQEDYFYDLDLIIEMICYAINEGGESDGEWDDGFKFEIGE